MSKIWAISLCSLSELRETQLSSLLNIEEATLKFDGLWSNQSRLDKKISLKIKTYKTLSGANRGCDILNERYQGESIRIQPHFDGKRWIREIVFDKAKFKFVPIEITQMWNENIDNLIKQKNLEYNEEIKKLLERKV
jgi:hypothetical protein